MSLLRLVEVSCAAAALFGATALAGLSGCTAEDPGYVPSDAGTRDGAAMDGSRADGGGVDGGPFDAGDVDGASSMDAGDVDGEPTDAGSLDAEATDAGMDAGAVSMPCTAAGACDPFVPTSCPAAELCQPGADGGTACITGAAILHGEGETCMFGDECGPGTLCLNFGDGFKCQRMCPSGSIGFCAGETRCFGTIGDTCVRICRPRAAPCDIFAQDCTDAADTCTLATDPETGARYTGCRPAGMQNHLEPCGGMAGACGHGLICINESVDGGTASRCRFVCGADGGMPACTAAGEACTGFARSWAVPYCR